MRRATRTYGTAAIAALALIASACGGGGGAGGGGGSAGATPGVTATTITFGSHQPLTGPAAPGYSEIAPASKAYFDYVNAHGGIYGRKIIYKYLDDAYNPTQTVQDVRQLVLQDHVFGIFSGLGTPTHTKVVGFLNASRVPDLFVSSGCRCWNEPTTYPYTFGWQPDYVREGKILGQYVKEHFAGKRIAYFYQNDEFGKDGVTGLDHEIPSSQVVSRQSYQPGNVNVAPQVTAFAQARAQVIVSFSIPAYTALLRLTELRLNYNPQLVVTNVGSDPTTLVGLLEAFAKKGGTTLSGNPLIQGMITDAYLPPTGDTSNSWIALFQKVHNQYIPNLPFDGNVEYGMAQAYTLVQALQAAGKNLTRAGLVAAIEKSGSSWQGPGLVPLDYSTTSHAGFTGVQIGTIQGNTIVLQGQPMTTGDGSGPITPVSPSTAVAPANGVPTG